MRAALNLNIPVVVVARPASRQGAGTGSPKGYRSRVACCREEVLSWAKKIAGDTI